MAHMKLSGDPSTSNRLWRKENTYFFLKMGLLYKTEKFIFDNVSEEVLKRILLMKEISTVEQPSPS